MRIDGGKLWKWFKNLVRYAYKLLLALCLLLILIPVILTLPPIKKRIIQKANQEISGVMQGAFKLQNYTYVFPVGLSIQGINFHDEYSDVQITTLKAKLHKFSRKNLKITGEVSINSGDIFLSVNTITKLASNEKKNTSEKDPKNWVIGADLKLKNTFFTWSNIDSIQVFSGGAQSVKINNAKINLLQREIEWGRVEVDSACASVISGGVINPQDTVSNGYWVIQGKTVILANSYFDLQVLPDKLFLSSDINSILVKNSAINLADKSIKVSGLDIDGLHYLNLIKPDTLQELNLKDSERKPFDWDIQLTSGDLTNINFVHSMAGRDYVDTIFSSGYLVINDLSAFINQAKFSHNDLVFSAKDLYVTFNDRINLQNAKLELESSNNDVAASIYTLLNGAIVNCSLALKEGYSTILQNRLIPDSKINLDIENLRPSDFVYFTSAVSKLPQPNDLFTCVLKANIENEWAEITECLVKSNLLGEINITGEIDQLNSYDSLMFRFTNALSIKPAYFKTFISDSTGINKFLSDELFTIKGNVVGNKTSIHAKQHVLSEYIDVPIEASYFMYDSSFQVSSKEIKIRGDSLFDIPFNIISGDLYADGNLRDGPLINAKSELNKISILERPYSNIQIHASINEKNILGNLFISDSLLQSNIDITLKIDSGISAIADGEIKLSIDSLNSKIDKFSIASEISLSYLKTNDSLHHIEAVFSKLTTNINDDKFELDTFHLTLNEENNSSQIGLRSDFIEGNFIFNSLFDNMLSWLGNGMGYSTKDDTVALIDYFSTLPGFQFQAHIKTHPILEKFVLQEKIEFEDMDIRMLSVQNGEKKSTLEIENLKSEKTEVGETRIEAELISDKLSLEANLEGVVRENMFSEHFHISGEMGKGYILSRIGGYSRNTSPQFLVSAEIYKDRSLFSLRIPDDTVIFAGNSWSINHDNIFSFTVDTIIDANVKLSRGKKRIVLQNTYSCPIQFSSENIDLKPIFALITTSSVFSGIMNSTICFPYHDFSDIQSSIDILDLVVDGEQIGNYKIENTLSLSDKSGIDLSGNIILDDVKKIDVSGTIDRNSWKNSTLSLQLNDVSLKLMRILFNNYINELQGTLNGNLVFDGSSDALWSGNLGFRDLVIDPKMVNNRLHFTDNTLVFRDRIIALNKLPITDEQGKHMLIDGKLDFRQFNKPTLHLSVRTDSMQILNIPDKKNNPLFGSVIASNQLKVNGPLKSPMVNLNLRLIKGTDFTFRISENLSSFEGQGVINFISEDYQEEDQDEHTLIFKTKETGIDFDAKVVIDPETRLRLKYTENMDFDIVLSGNGNITYKGDRSGKENMVGTYTVRRGQAVLKLQGLAAKNFTISPRSYLRWDGAIDNPIVDIQAIYTVKGSYENPAAGMSNTIIVDYDVIFAFKNRLQKPEILFDLETKDQYMTTVLNAIPEEERVKQAINVLLLGYIVTPETKGGASKIITDHINQFWAQQLNSAADKSFGGVEVSVDIQSITNYSAGSAQDQTNLSYEVKKDIWNERATVKVGGYVRTYTSSPQDASSRLIGDFSLEYKLNKKENLYGKLFSENKYEGILEGEIQRTGVGILYRQNYQSMSELWERRKQNRDEKKKKK